MVSAEASGQYSPEPPEPPRSLDLVSSELLTGEENVKARAEVETTGDAAVDYAEFHAKILDAEGVVLGGDWTNETNIRAGATWRVEQEWDGRSRINRADDLEVVLSERPL